MTATDLILFTNFTVREPQGGQLLRETQTGNVYNTLRIVITTYVGHNPERFNVVLLTGVKSTKGTSQRGWSLSSSSWANGRTEDKYRNI